MLSYRHSFHAGNHGDVLKHWSLVTMLDYLNQKDKPYWYIDTHSGAGRYHLGDAYSQKNREHEQGIQRLLGEKGLPESLARYVALITDLGGVSHNGNLQGYPGSPVIAQKLAREQDKLRLFELHKSDSRKLESQLAADHRVRVEASDGFCRFESAIAAPTKRGLIMIDPSYEVKSDYSKALKVIPDAVRRFPVGVFALWYPLLSHLDNVNFQERILKLDGMKWMDLRLCIDDRPTAKGMYGSGLLVVNPPWQLQAQAAQVLPCLADKLGVDGAGAWRIRDSGNL